MGLCGIFWLCVSNFKYESKDRVGLHFQIGMKVKAIVRWGFRGVGLLAVGECIFASDGMTTRTILADGEEVF